MKKGQMKLSFGMIFSIILIIVFLVFAFIAIQKFLDFQREAQIRQFYSSFSKDVNSVYESQASTLPVTYSLPGDITRICFASVSNGNIHLVSEKSDDWSNVKNIKFSDGLCIEKTDGKFSFTLEKNYGEALVTILE